MGKEINVRQIPRISIVALSVAAGLAACGSGKTSTAQDDFANDLRLAQSSTLNLAQPKVDASLLNSLETKPQGAPAAATTIKRGAGNRAVRSHTPTVRATPDVALASTDDQSQSATTVQEAPAPEISEPAAVAPRATPAPTDGMGTGSGDYGTSGNGGGIFGPGGGMGGVVMRGGGADGDHCEIHTGGRRGGSGPIFIPATGIPRSTGTGGGYPRSGGSIGSQRAGGGSTVSRPGGMGSRGRRG